ncbi:site-specific integrase [Comamonas sp. w2-DMI]|uniref:site-specific integrase n=1 Tax=Comamonas sp. w2-DMI TaxID=3126391 RepID=UPI0032E3F662
MAKIKVQDFNLGALEIAFKGFNSSQKPIGNFTLEEITVSTINSYVKSRIQDNLRASSIRTELVLMNSVLEYSKHLNSDLKDFKNPIKDFDKKLYSLAIPAKSKFFRFADSEEENKITKKAFIEAVEKNKNPELVFIVKLMMLTAMRRAEVVLLKWSQIYENFIQLTDTKTNPRPVYLTADAKELIKSIPRKSGQDRLFSYTVGGFEASLRYHLNKFGLKDITAHKLRKNSISEFVEVIGADNSLLISEILGIRDIAGLEREIKTMPTSSLNTQTEVLKSVGHTTSAVTKKHYFSLNLKKQK